MEQMLVNFFWGMIRYAVTFGWIVTPVRGLLALRKNGMAGLGFKNCVALVLLWGGLAYIFIALPLVVLISTAWARAHPGLMIPIFANFFGWYMWDSSKIKKRGGDKGERLRGAGLDAAAELIKRIDNNR